MASYKLWKVTRKVTVSGESVKQTVVAGGCSYFEAQIAARELMTDVVEEWDIDELTDAEYTEHYKHESTET